MVITVLRSRPERPLLLGAEIMHSGPLASPTLLEAPRPCAHRGIRNGPGCRPGATSSVPVRGLGAWRCVPCLRCECACERAHVCAGTGPPPGPLLPYLSGAERRKPGRVLSRAWALGLQRVAVHGLGPTHRGTCVI